MNEQFWWFLSRSSGIVTWALLAATTLWGIFLSTRMLKPYDRPAWLRDLHTWLGTLTLLGTGVHILAIMADSYVQFSVKDILVPMSATWKPLALAWGIVSMYMLLAVQISSWAMKKIPRKLWRAIHFLSYGLFATTSIHSLSAGTDRSALLYQGFSIALITLVLGAIAIRIVYAGDPKTRDVISRASAGVTTAAAAKQTPSPPTQSTTPPASE
jgi:predicted ferric reductase